MKTSIYGACAVLLILAPGVMAQTHATKVVVSVAKVMEAPSTTQLVGDVDGVRRSRVAAELAGLVLEMPGRQGQHVDAGGVICRLDAKRTTLSLVAEKARLQSLQSQLDKLRNGSRPEEITEAKAALDEADAWQKRWALEKERVEQLYGSENSHHKEMYDTLAEYHAAQGRFVAARAAYDLAVAGPRQEDIAQAAFEVAEQQAVVDLYETDVEKMTVRSPFDGSIVHRVVEVGEWVPVGGTVAELVDLGSVLVRVDAPESAMLHVHIGDQARVYVEAIKKTFTGTIQYVIPQSDSTAHTFPVEILVDNTDGLLAAGMFAKATITTGPKTEVVAIPQDCLVDFGGMPHVAILIPGQGGAWNGMLQPVTVGAEVGSWIAVTSGNIAPGTRVITHGNERMMPFPSPVIVVDESGTPVQMPAGDGAAAAPGGGN